MTEKTLHRQTAFEGRLLRVDVARIRLPDGTETTREIVRHPDAVCAAVLTSAGELVLVRQYRAPVECALLEIPAGKIDPGETSEQAVRRELQEEIGLLDGRIEKLAEFFMTPGFCTERMTVYLVRDAVLGEPAFDHGEFLEVVKVRLEDAPGMIQAGVLQDAKSIAGVLLARQALQNA